MSSSVAWSDDRVTTLRKLWIEGLSASQIARSLGGVSRSAVIGKVHRLGIAARGTPSAPGRPARAPSGRAPAVRPARSSVAPTLVIQASAVPDAEGPGLVAGVMGLSAHVCRWPIGDPKAEGFSFCGRPAAGRYCPSHARASLQPGKAARLDRDPIVRRALAGRA